MAEQRYTDWDVCRQTILEDCWRPTNVRSLVPKFTALRRDVEA